MPGLNDKQQKFCEEYLIDLNATQAAIRAGYSSKTARSIGQRLLTNVDIQARIQELQLKRSDRTSIKADRVLQELARVAFADVTDVIRFDDGGIMFNDSSALDKDVTAAIASISHQKTDKGTTRSVRMHNKVGALLKLVDHLGLADDENKALSTLRRYGYKVERTETGYLLTDSYLNDADSGETETSSAESDEP